MIKLNLLVIGLKTRKIKPAEFVSGLLEHYIEFRGKGFWVIEKYRFEEYKWRSEYLKQAMVAFGKFFDITKKENSTAYLSILKNYIGMTVKRITLFKKHWMLYETKSEGFEGPKYYGMLREQYPAERDDHFKINNDELQKRIIFEKSSSVIMVALNDIKEAIERAQRFKLEYLALSLKISKQRLQDGGEYCYSVEDLSKLWSWPHIFQSKVH